MYKDKKIIIRREDIIFGLIALFVVFGIILGFVWSANTSTYISSESINCYDNHGNQIKGLVCYEEITCSTKMKFFNNDGCNILLINGTIVGNE